MIVELYFIFINKKITRSSTTSSPQWVETQISPLPVDPAPPSKVERVPTFVMVPEFRSSIEDSVYGDILSHSDKAPFGDSAGRATNSHETAHGIHSYLRNKYTVMKDGKLERFNGFYVL